MKEWLRIAWSPSVRRRATRVALVVGTVLIAINHGDALLAGDVSTLRLVRMALTLIVPYLVSTFASVGATLDCEEALEASSSPEPPVRKVERLAS